MKKATRRSFTQLTQSERDSMEILLEKGHLQKEVARILKVDPSTISRERKRKRKNGYYDARNAQIKRDNKRRSSKYQGMKIQNNQILKKMVIEELKKRRSPDEIAGRLRMEGMRIDKNTIYK